MFGRIIDNDYMGCKIGRFTIDRRQMIKIADESVYLFLGEMYLSPLSDSVHSEDVQVYEGALKSVMAGRQVRVILRVRRKDGLFIWTYVVMKRLPDNEGLKGFVEVYMYDIAHLALDNSHYRDEVKKITAILNMSEDSLFEYDMNTGRFKLYYLKDFKEIILEDCQFDEWKCKVEANEWVETIHLQHFEKMCSDIKSGCMNFFYQIRNSILTKGRSMDYTHIKGTAIENNMKISTVVGTITTINSINDRDITFLANRSNLDPLTGLLNKRAIAECAREKIQSAGPEDKFTFIILDLDYFKDINDNYGHMFGDEVLVSVATVLKSVVGTRGKVGRIGGDEFFAILDIEGDEESLRPILKAIRSHIEFAYSDKIQSLRLTTSIGTCTYPRDAQNYDDLFKLADKCLYIAKEKGRNRFITYNKSIHGSLEDILSNENTINIEKQRSEAEKLESLLKVIENIFNEGKSCISKVLDYLREYYDVDRISILSGENMSRVYCSSNYQEQSNECIGELLQDYLVKFNSCNVFTIGNYDNVRGTYPKLYKVLKEQESYSVLQYLIQNDGDIWGLIIFDTHKRYKKWSESDVRYITVVCKVIAQTMLNEK